MTEKNKLTEELMREYGLTDEPKAEPKPQPKVAPAPVAPAVSLASEETIVSDEAGAGNPFLALKQQQEDEEKAQPKNEFQRNPELTGMGALLGGMAQYKGVGQNLFNPAPDLFTHRYGPIAGQSNMPSAAGEPLSDVQHTLQSGQGQRPGETGRMRENTHNQETNRQALALKLNTPLPGAERALVEAGPMVTTKSGIPIPLRAANQIEEELKIKQMISDTAHQKALDDYEAGQKRLKQQQENRAKIIGASKGIAKIGQGVVGGALAAPALYEYARDALKQNKNNPADTTQGLSGLGGLMMALGKNKMGGLGAALQLPYIIKHRDELSRSLNMSDVVPDVVKMGMTGAEMYEPADRGAVPLPNVTHGVKY
jgi:hypothetical protein